MACAGCGATLGGATMYACRRSMFSLCCSCKVVVVKDYDDALRARDAQLAEQSAAVGLIRQYLEDRDSGYDALAMDDWDQLRNLLAPTPEPPRDDAAEPEPRPEDEPDAD